MTSKYDFDLFVIGAGSGGVRAARLAAEAGARVAIAERDRFGGTCVIRGCIPKKFLVYASAFPEEFEDAVGYGWSIDGTRFDWQTLIAGKDRVLERLEGYYRRAVEVPGGTIFDDSAVLKDRHTVHLAGRDHDVTAETILIATGGTPMRNVGIDGQELCITSDEAFNLKKFPDAVIVVGAGYIALEFAHIFHGLGAQTTLVYRGEKILRGFDDDLRNAVEASLQHKGIRLELGTVLTRCEKRDGRIRVTLATGESLMADQVLIAIGRSPNTRGLGLEESGVKLTERGHIAVDHHSRSSIGNIYAVGDVTGRMELTPVAIHEAAAFVKTVYGHASTAPEYDFVATAVFTRPEIGTVGLSEAKALKRGHTVDIYKTSFRPLKHTMSGRQDRTMMKLVVDAKTDRVLGCHIFGPEASEMIQLVAIALKLGATKAQFDATVAVHPTMAEELVTIRQKHATVEPG